MIDRKSALRRLVVGDICHGTCPNGASLICLVEAVTDDRIEARRVTTQDHVVFDRATGLTLPIDDHAGCTIDSIAPLPVAIHNVMLGLDRRMRLMSDSGPLDEEEKAAFRFIISFYPAHPLKSDDDPSNRPN
ncbi:hypothetical protein BH11PSE3_BH11PSE3_37080 [soil metagenome]